MFNKKRLYYSSTSVKKSLFLMKKVVSFLTFCMVIPLAVLSQHSIKGKITDTEGNALTGASVGIVNTYRTTHANANGDYAFTNLQNGNYEVVVFFVGHEKQTQSISLIGADVELNFSLNRSSTNLGEVVVEGTRVKEDAPIAHENFSKEQLSKFNNGVDIPVMLDQATSIVTTTDAGAGVGYTGLRIRGSDGTRINVTVNGIPMNDPESHGVWWVNMPDLASSTSSIQIQRGVGTSTNGAGAFGASINVNTLEGETDAYGEVASSYGSFNTYKNTIKFGSGLIDNKWTFDGRLSKINSDGYIDRATSDLQSYYFSAGYNGKNSLLKFITFAGHEKTYQAWYGVPKTYLDTNRTFNPYTYDNEVDNYQQHHYQLHYVYSPSQHFKVNAALHYTRGFGFFEQYKGVNENPFVNDDDGWLDGEYFEDYGLNPVITAKGDTITQTDLIRRRWLDNHFYGGVFSAEYSKENTTLVFGGGVNQYLGKHFGEVIWAEFSSNGKIRHPYYDNDATKNDANIYAKISQNITKDFSIFADAQVRNVTYTFMGFNADLKNITKTEKLFFFNPKAGLNYRINETQHVYGFFGVGNKEPNRDDYTESEFDRAPKPEQMFNTEIGYRVQIKKLFAHINVYSMEYKNQIVPTGEYNDVGAYIRSNVDVSYRRGIELTAGVRPMNKLEWRFNATLSQNKIVQFDEYIDNWDTWEQDVVTHKNTDIAFSPNIIAGSELIFTPISDLKKGNLELAIISKYVGEQFIDNTSSIHAKLDAYFVNDVRVQYSKQTKVFKEVILSTWVRNIFNEQYSSNAWVYRFTSSGGTYGDPYGNNDDVANNRYNLMGVFPQAGINFFVGVTLRF
jgi:iron complex outermembrane recepter protein